MIKKLLFALLGLLLTVIAILAAGVAWLAYDAKRVPVGHGEYVAMGSSFSAAPGVLTRDPNAPFVCYRSIANYAHLLAQKRGLKLEDVTCGGADIHTILTAGQFFQRPQIEAITSKTKLVTVTIGGNDIWFLGNLVAWSCQNRPEKVPAFLRSVACRAKSDAAVDEKLKSLPAAMRKLAEAVHQRAPGAKLIFVDYTTVVAQSKDCPERFPLTAAQLKRARFMASELARVTAEAAADTDSLLVKASQVTEAHDICSADPWVFGFEFPASLFAFGPAAYHPTAPAMRAIADAIDQSLP